MAITRIDHLQVNRLDVQETVVSGGTTFVDLANAATDEKAKVSSNDTTPGFLNGKLVAGTNITLTENNNGGNETLTISAAGGGGVTGFTPSQNTAAPNATINASRLLVDVATSSGDFVLQAKGFGGIMAQLPDATSTGGNKRGSYSVDWQMHRASADQVATGNYSVVLGGSSNTAVQDYSVVGGRQNKVSAYSAVVSGYQNWADNTYCFIGSGQSNYAGGDRSSIINGNSNIVFGSFSTIINGSANSISSNDCFIFGGSNNSISSGCNRSQIIGGQNSYILNDAGGSKPDNTVIGGGFIENSDTSIAAGYGNVDGASSGISMGSGAYVLNCQYGTAIGGNNNIAQGNFSTALGGEQSYAYGNYSLATGERGTATQHLQRIHGAKAISNQGDIQHETMVVSGITSDATPKHLTANRSNPSSTNVIIVEPNTSKVFHGIVLAHRTDVKQAIGWEIKGVITNIGGTTTLVGTPTVTVLGDSTSSGATITVTADDTLDCLVITATGGVGKTFRWLATVNANKITG